MRLPSGRNPWFSMWTTPRATVREILDTDPSHNVTLLAVLNGFFGTLDLAVSKNAGDHFTLPVILLFCVIGGIPMGLVTIYLGGALISWTGRWIGGSASPAQARAAWAWATVPLSWAGLLYVPWIAWLGRGAFIQEPVILKNNPLASLAMAGTVLLEMIIAVWFLVIFWKSIGEAQRFSAARVLQNVVLAAVVTLVPVMLLGMLAAIIVPMLKHG